MSRAEGRRVEKMSDESKDVGFYNPHDGLKGRDGGPYLDHIERQAAEVSRARLEGREPADPWGVLPATAGTPLVVASQVVDNSWTSNPSMAHKPTLAAVLDDEGLGKGKPWGELKDASFTSPVSVGSVDLRTEAPNEDEVNAVRGDSSDNAIDHPELEHHDLFVPEQTDGQHN